MNPEYTICESCYIRSLCHHQITPIKLARSGMQINLDKNREYALWQCEWFTCPDGKKEAQNALSEGNFVSFNVIEMDNTTNTVMAVPFGSEHKPTYENGRIVTQDGKIYSYADGQYYRSGNL